MKILEYKQIDMTRGAMLPSIVAFSIPLLIGSFFQTVYNTVDSVVIGNFADTDALAAVGACMSPMLLLLSVMLGFSNGVSVWVSQMFGAGDGRRVREAVATANGFFWVSVIPITAVAILLVEPLLTIIDVRGAGREYAYWYLLIIFGGLFGTYGFNLNSGLLRGLGDSRSPLLFLLISFAVNLALDLLFVIVMGWGVAGVAVATVIAQAVSWLYSLAHIRKHFPHLEYRLFSLKIYPEHLRKIVSLGVPMAMSHAIFSLGFLLYYRFVNGFGPAFMAGYGIAGKLENMTWLPISSLGMAAVAFAGQNGGAGNVEWLDKGVRLFLKTSIGINVFTSVLVLVFGRRLLGFFTPDPAVIEAGYRYLTCLMPFYWIYSIIHILSSFMNGVGDVRIPTLVMLVMFWGVRVPLAWYLSKHYPGEYLHIAYPVSWLAGCIGTVVYFRTGRWRRGISVKSPRDPAAAASARLPGCCT